MVSVKNDPRVHKIWALMECSFLQKTPPATGMVRVECPEELGLALVALNYQEYLGENLVKLSCFE